MSRILRRDKGYQIHLQYGTVPDVPDTGCGLHCTGYRRLQFIGPDCLTVCHCEYVYVTVMCRDARHAFDVMSPNYIAVENLLPHGRPSKHYDHRQ